MSTKFAELKAALLMRAAGFIGQRHSVLWKRWLARAAVRLNLMRHGRDPLGFLQAEDSIDHLDYESTDEAAACDTAHQGRPVNAAARARRGTPQ